MSIDKFSNERIRYAIMVLLRTEYPSAISTEALSRALTSLGYVMSEGKLQQHVAYLNEKVYAGMDTRKEAGMEITWVTLTAEGWDKLDGLAPGEGVDTEL